MPPGTRVAGRAYALPAREVEFIADITAADAYGHPVVSQAIFDRVLAIVHAAREFIVLDYFLFNGAPSTASDSPPPLRRISQELRDALIERRRAVPALQVLLITDPINEIYGAAPSSDFAALRAAGVDIAVTDVARLRDSNFLYSSLWRLTVGWWRPCRRRWVVRKPARERTAPHHARKRPAACQLQGQSAPHHHRRRRSRRSRRHHRIRRPARCQQRLFKHRGQGARAGARAAAGKRACHRSVFGLARQHRPGTERGAGAARPSRRPHCTRQHRHRGLHARRAAGAHRRHRQR